MPTGTDRDDHAVHLPILLRRIVLMAIAASTVLGVTLVLAFTGPGSFANLTQAPFPPPRPSPQACEAACDACEQDCLREPESCPACTANFEECCEAAAGLPLEDCQCLTEDMADDPTAPRP